MALSLREKSKYHINIIGFSEKNETSEENIKFTPILYASKKIWIRICANFNFLRAIEKQQPDIVIISTWELLPAAYLGKMRWNYRLIYDVQENYSLNVEWNQPSKSSTLKKWLQRRLIQLIEHHSISFVDHFILAEDCYEQELPRFKPFTYLPNTFFGKEIIQSRIIISSTQPLNFLLTGTLTPVYGIIEGIYWFKSFLHHYPNAKLEIFGHCTDESFAQSLIDFVYNEGKITLNMSQNPVPYPEILQAYNRNDIVLLPYRLLPSIEPKIPSKLYECLALKKPMIYTQNPLWDQLVDRYQAGIAVNWQENTDISATVDRIFNTTFYTTSTIPEALWTRCEFDFFELIQSLEPSR